MGVIRSREHHPKDGYDGHDGSKESEAPAAPAFTEQFRAQAVRLLDGGGR
jgi:hypothetical protein